MNARPSETCVTEWLDRLQAGDAEAARRLWEGYFGKLVALARARLRAAPRAAADEEDVALSVFDSFFHGAEAGRFPRLNDRHDLWQVLSMLTQRKAVSLARRERRQKRGGGNVVQASALAKGDEAHDPLAGIPTSELEPQLAALVTDECRRLLDMLGDDTLRRIALWKMEGHTNAAIAGKIECVEKTVERKLKLIRDIWEGEVGT